MSISLIARLARRQIRGADNGAVLDWPEMTTMGTRVGVGAPHAVIAFVPPGPVVTFTAATLPRCRVALGRDRARLLVMAKAT